MLLNSKEKEYKSWYDLSYNEANTLEREFLSHEMGKDANYAMHICIIIGILTFTLSAIILAIILLKNIINIYTFVILVMGIIFGMIIVVASTIEYHLKFNSWLKITKKIIKK